MKKLIPLLAITLSLGVIVSCTNNPRSPQQFDTNPAEAAETPGDLHRGDAETNAQAEAKAPAHEIKQQETPAPLGKQIAKKKSVTATKPVEAEPAETTGANVEQQMDSVTQVVQEAPAKSKKELRKERRKERKASRG